MGGGILSSLDQGMKNKTKLYALEGYTENYEENSILFWTEGKQQATKAQTQQFKYNH